jgi:hypothetical protein
VRGAEFPIFFGLLMAPPLLLGFATLVLLRQRFARSAGLVKLGAAAIVLASSLTLGVIVIGPAWLGRYLGVRDMHVFGVNVSSAPFAFLAVGVAVVSVLAWAARGRR